MKKRLQLKKITLRTLDEDTPTHMAGGNTYTCQGQQTASCQGSNCDTCGNPCVTHGYPCSQGCGTNTCGYSCQTCAELSCFDSCPNCGTAGC
jgi:hypothetical protein